LKGTEGSAIKDGKVLPLFGLDLLGLGICPGSFNLHGSILGFRAVLAKLNLSIDRFDLGVVFNASLDLQRHALGDLLRTAVDTPPVLDILGIWIVVLVRRLEVQLFQDTFRERLIIPSCTAIESELWGV
jgi:hypothetical protein